MKVVVLCLLALVALFKGQVELHNQVQTASHCEPITDISICSQVGYNTSFPNMRGHASQHEANTELLLLTPFLEVSCSDLFLQLVCAVYAPYCITRYPGVDSAVCIPPCKELCDEIKKECEPVLQEHNLTWPSAFLNCSAYDSRERSLCSLLNLDTIFPTDEGRRISVG